MVQDCTLAGVDSRQKDGGFKDLDEHGTRRKKQ